jgi:diguanylate cyclase (GGDEF)-like protein
VYLLFAKRDLAVALSLVMTVILELDAAVRAATTKGISVSLTDAVIVALAAGCVGLLCTTFILRRDLNRTRTEGQREIAQLRGELAGLERGRDDLELLSSIDPLTGVWNYRHLQMALAAELERCRRHSKQLAVLMLDLDHFRLVNQAYGHQRGSVVLRELAQRVALEIRQPDVFARYGGEEFVLLLPDTGAEGAARVAERLCYAVRRHQFEGLISHGDEPGPPVKVTVTIGGAVFPDHGEHGAVLLRRADEALASAKREGRDRWRLADDAAGAHDASATA